MRVILSYTLTADLTHVSVVRVACGSKGTPALYEKAWHVALTYGTHSPLIELSYCIDVPYTATGSVP